MTTAKPPSTCEDSVLSDYVTVLRAKLGTRLREVWLFGSRARGDWTEKSDYDVLVVAEGELKDTRSIVSDTDYYILSTHNELIGAIVYTPEIWHRSRYGPLGINVRADGRQIV